MSLPWLSLPNRHWPRQYGKRTPHERAVSRLDDVGDWDFDGFDHTPPKMNGIVWASSVTRLPHEFSSCWDEGAYALAWALAHPRRDVRRKIEEFEARQRIYDANQRFRERCYQVGWHQAVYEQRLWEMRHG